MRHNAESGIRSRAGDVGVYVPAGTGLQIPKLPDVERFVLDLCHWGTVPYVFRVPLWVGDSVLKSTKPSALDLFGARAHFHFRRYN